MSNANRAKRRLLAAAVGVALVAVAAAASAYGRDRSGAEVGQLALRATFSMRSTEVECPAGTDPSIECYARTGSGVVPGLDNVSESYVFVVDQEPGARCPNGLALLGATARFTVVGKGAIELAIGASPDCFGTQTILDASRPFTITGGSGLYAGASGSGTLHHEGHSTSSGVAGTDTWDGTLIVRGFDFDVIRPKLSGAIAKTVRARREAKTVRVRFTVTARDEVDGSLPVTCKPRSCSRFKLGKTRVTCAATDRSGHTATVKFMVTVKARR